MSERSAKVRRSETIEQQEYEKSILHGQLPQPEHHGDHEGDEKAAHESEPSLKAKVKGFWKDHVKPAFPEAIADFSILKTIATIEYSVTKDLHDTTRFPEVAHIAEVRRGLELSPSEKSFLADRKAHVRNNFAKYLGLDPTLVHPDDIPVVGFGGSGGGFRAMIGYLAYAEQMKQDGLWDLFTYVAGVSGSCWSLAAYYTFGEVSMAKVIEHCKKRFSPYHPLSAEAIRKLLTAPGGVHTTIGPLVAKHHSGLHTVAMDLYSVFTTGYVFLQDDPVLRPDHPGHGTKKEVAGYHRDWYKWSAAQHYLTGGAEPLPILTSIRHERPWKDWADPEHPFKEPDHEAEAHAEAQDAWFQWFEMTPFEIGCDELEAWVPTWGFGRPFSEGKSVMQLPEQSLALLLGLCTGAPAGPLSSYIATINRALPAGFLANAIHDLSSRVSKFWGKQGTEEFQSHHPLHACNEHNFVYHLTKVEKGKPSPPGLEHSPRIHLIDSGLDNNCPTYVLLHPERQVDVIINMDASSDVQKDTFQERVDQIGSRRGLKFTKRHDIKAGTDEKDPDRFNGLYGQIYDSTLIERPPTVVDSYGKTVKNPPAPVCHHECTMVYMPLLPNEKAVPDFDPSTAKFSGSYNLVWTPEQVEMLVKVCNANFVDGRDTIKTALHDAWMRKKAKREAVESGMKVEAHAAGP